MPDQNPVSARQLERIIELDRLLRQNCCPGIGTLAGRLGVSERTIFRDLVFLRDRLRAPVFFDSGRGGYRYSAPHRFFPGISLTREEVLALLLAMKAAGPIMGRSFEARLRSAVSKVLSAGGISGPGREGEGQLGPPFQTV
ncbi:MAG: HTH domain-containing protein [Burkholderiales bacterium]|jgi:predicted DNA-binding transcriptional regulator YafY|nr:HTH domain-containing protein [Burkholderiales bacterium]